MTLEIAVLVSVGRHPVSGRARRARTDAQALELGLRLAAARDAHLEVVHAGHPGEPALRDYLGMGVETMRVLHVEPDADPLPALIEWLGAARPSLVLTGTRAESGWSSGCVPYALAAAVEGVALVPGAVDLMLDARTAEILQALPRGQRRRLRAMLPTIVTVHPSAPVPRQSAYARARRGEFVVSRPAVPPVAMPDPGDVRAARARTARPRGATDKSAVARLRALTTGPVRDARIVHAATPADAAREICALLGERRLLQRADRRASTHTETHTLARDGEQE